MGMGGGGRRKGGKKEMEKGKAGNIHLHLDK